MDRGLYLLYLHGDLQGGLFEGSHARVPNVLSPLPLSRYHVFRIVLFIIIIEKSFAQAREIIN